MSNSKATSGGVSLATVLVAIFVVLKLTHVIDWSWWWVFSPWWIGIAIFAAILAVIGLVAGVVLILKRL
ncbi:MAG TPA: hypothetical protein P5105_02550 [Victivallales bacterium]|nr:hypothetical protein [Candidatus Methanofastidiosa archaeon]HRR06140.1 hypothetical protein [Victivallales bacterium]